MSQSSLPHVTHVHPVPRHGAPEGASLRDGCHRTPSSNARGSHTLKQTAPGTLLEA